LLLNISIKRYKIFCLKMWDDYESFEGRYDLEENKEEHKAKF